jgi:hypothetical protein
MASSFNGFDAFKTDGMGLKGASGLVSYPAIKQMPVCSNQHRSETLKPSEFFDPLL